MVKLSPKRRESTGLKAQSFKQEWWNDWRLKTGGDLAPPLPPPLSPLSLYLLKKVDNAHENVPSREDVGKAEVFKPLSAQLRKPLLNAKGPVMSQAQELERTECLPRASLTYLDWSEDWRTEAKQIKGIYSGSLDVGAQTNRKLARLSTPSGRLAAAADARADDAARAITDLKILWLLARTTTPARPNGQGRPGQLPDKDKEYQDQIDCGEVDIYYIYTELCTIL
ncbi:hypothetical protein F5Y19DRAFT_472804 [Xylariaceae sp. FL1651]|nr:hypothetical protein F5Y19DRAFT_472804 [Xylariaceae sp. FL1651]